MRRGGAALALGPLPGEPTKRQLDVWRAMRTSQDENHGRPPTVREVARLVGLSPVRAFDHLVALARRGLAVHQPGRGFVALPCETDHVVSREG